MALPKHSGPGALTRKMFGYTAPNREQLIEELEYITVEMGGVIKVTPTQIVIDVPDDQPRIRGDTMS